MKLLLAIGLLLLGSDVACAQPPIPLVTPKIYVTPAEIERIIGPSTFSLELQDVPFEAAVSQVMALIGARFKITDRGAFEKERVTVSLKDISFWRALDAVLRSAEASYTYEDGVINVLPKHLANTFMMVSNPMPLYECGPFMARINAMTRVRRLNLLSAPIEDQAAVGVLLILDPRLSQPRDLEQKAEFMEARDDKGNELKSNSRGIHTIGNRLFQNSWVSEWAMNLTGFAPGSKRIALLRGQLEFPVILKKEAWRIPLPMDGDEATRSTKLSHFSVSPLKKTASGYEVVIKRSFVDENQIENYTSQWYRYFSEVEPGDMRLEDEQGNAYERRRSEAQADRHTMIVRWSLPPTGQDTPGQPARLLWDVPTDIRFVKFPFEFHDVATP